MFLINIKFNENFGEVAMRARVCLIVFILLSTVVCSSCLHSERFVTSFAKDANRTWIGPDFWANRLQDWALVDGQIRCIEKREVKPMRTLHLLSLRMNPEARPFKISVITGSISKSGKLNDDAFSGFLIGAGAHLDQRAAALIHHAPGPEGGILLGMDGRGRAVVRSMEKEGYPVLASSEDKPAKKRNKNLILLKGFSAADGYHLILEIKSPKKSPGISTVEYVIDDPQTLAGNIALVSHPGTGENTTSFWYDKWIVSGTKINPLAERPCGPIISTQHTLSNGTLKLTAQLMPVGKTDSKTVSLEIRKDGKWQEIAEAELVVPGYSATFKIDNWEDDQPWDFRAAYKLKDSKGQLNSHYWGGTIMPDPVNKETITLAAFTGNHNMRFPKPWVGVEAKTFPWNNGVWFPHADLTDNLRQHLPDILFFSGDQVYEGFSPTSAEFKDRPELDYLYKWYLWCWAFRDLTRNTPSVVIPDDHDIYQGNIWGAGGRKTDKDNKGGYVMPPEWVNMVERTQTSHLPDPYDPTPVEQGIGVYYTSLNYGRISFAVIEDRKFKSGPSGITPPTKSGRADHVIDPAFDPKTADVKGATLLGQRQLDFLEAWAKDWKNADMKAVLSQTVFANAASIHGPEKKRLVADYDSNGWPQTGRNKALEKMRKGYATHISGDQHLATIIHYGIDEFDDAGWSLCVPSVANFYPRSWSPLDKPVNHQEGMPDYTGSFYDGFHNRITVWAAANPGFKSGKEPAELHDRVPGYGLAKFHKNTGEVTLECWPRYVNPNDPSSGSQYPGWPRTFNMLDNYGKKALGYLPEIKVTGVNNPVIQVIKEKSGEVVYTLRIRGNSFRPKVFSDESYQVIVSEPDEGKTKKLEGLRISPEEKTVVVEF